MLLEAEGSTVRRPAAMDGRLPGGVRVLLEAVGVTAGRETGVGEPGTDVSG